MTADGSLDARVEDWLAALEARHLADLTPTEVARALRALSSCYVERRARLAEGLALGTAGKRAAFALFYAPLHFFTIRSVLSSLGPAADRAEHILDLGCGTGAAGAAWALGTGARVTGIDRHPWAVAEANWTYRTLGIDGRAVQQDVARVTIAPRRGASILAAYTVNELPDAVRGATLEHLLQAGRLGATVLVIEPVARRLTPWWRGWEDAFAEAGGAAAEWRFPAALPDRQRRLAKAAGLNPQELTARTLLLSPAAGQR